MGISLARGGFFPSFVAASGGGSSVFVSPSAGGGITSFGF